MSKARSKANTDELEGLLAAPFGLAGPKAERQAREWIVAIATTNESIMSIAKRPSLPSHMTMYIWETKSVKFAEVMLIARRMRAENYMDQALGFADDVDVEHGYGANRIAKVKLQTQVRQAWAARLSRDWMPRTAHEHSGPEGGPIKNDHLTDLSMEELRILRKVAKRQAEQE